MPWAPCWRYRGCAEPQCGDGEVEGSEECDDGNKSDKDSCLNACVKATCGDNKQRDKLEACDGGNTDNNDECTAVCQPKRCGDGFVEGGKEECDDANASNNDACTNLCKKALCGDGFVCSGLEQCDDGNLVIGDACTPLCLSGQLCGPGNKTCSGLPGLQNLNAGISLSVPRAWFGMTALAGRIFAVGGADANGQPLGSVESTLW